ncbi:MAG: glycosyltransferase family 39 protein [Gemmatimonadota bacterium]
MSLPDAAESRGRGDARVWTTVIGLTVLALLVRIPAANGGLWIDEIYSLVSSFRPTLVETITRFPKDNHHPLYSILAHVSMSAFGEHAWAIRLPSILFGAATVPLLYGFARYLTSTREALLSAALLAVSYHHVWFSTNARGYVMIAFFTIACTWSLLRLIEGGPASLALWYAACGALGAYTHLTMVFIVVAHALVTVGALLLHGNPRAQWNRWGRPVLAAFALAAVGTLLLYAPVLLQVHTFFADKPSALTASSTKGWAFVEGLRVLALGFGAGTIIVGVIVVAIAGALFMLGLRSFARNDAVALGLFVAPAFVILAGAQLARGTFYPRFLFALIGPGILIGVRGVMVASDWITQRLSASSALTGERLATAVMLGISVLSLASLAALYRHPKQDFDGAVRYVDATRTPGEAVITAGAAADPIQTYFVRDWPRLSTAAEVDQLRRRGPVWLVYTFPRYLSRSAPEIMTLANTYCRNAPRFLGTVGDGDIVTCRLPAIP